MWKQIFFIILLLSCDFAPRIHKQILYAQRLIGEQKYSLAIEQYKEILEKNPPEQTKLYFQIGEIYSSYLLKHEEAIEFYKKAIESSSNLLWMIKAEEKIAEINFSFLKDYEGAVQNYKKLVSFTPKLANIDFYQYRLAICYINSKRLDKGHEILDFINKRPDHKYYVQSFYQKGMNYFLQGKWRLAVQYWKQYIENEESEHLITQTKFLMANAYETMDDLKEAYEIYYSLLTTYPNIEVIKNRLDSIYQRRVTRKR